MSDHERIAQVAHQKWANEWIAHFFERIAHLLIFGQKTSDSLRKLMSKFKALVITYSISSVNSFDLSPQCHADMHIAHCRLRVWWNLSAKSSSNSKIVSICQEQTFSFIKHLFCHWWRNSICCQTRSVSETDCVCESLGIIHSFYYHINHLLEIASYHSHVRIEISFRMWTRTTLQEVGKLYVAKICHQPQWEAL